MQTLIHASLIDVPAVTEADRILRSCVHCGFCTAVCPTYQLLGDELDGPRGRIYLIKEMLESGGISAAATDHLDRCLTCRACETACPSGVEYGHLIDIGRGLIAEMNTPAPRASFYAHLLRLVVPRVRLFSWLLGLAQPLRPVFPAFLKNLVPAVTPKRHYPLRVIGGTNTRRVVVLAGCVQRAATPNVNHALEYLLSAHNIEVIYLSAEGCCGALDYHLAAHDVGQDRMRRLVDLLLPLLPDVEAVLSTASGCGVTVKDYGHILRDDLDYAGPAAAVAARVMDVSEYLQQFSFHCTPRTVAFHAPCTLQHGQKLTGKVEAILGAAGMSLVPVEESHLCCGSAGTYSIMQPEISSRLKARKLAALTSGQPEVIATANIGCQLQLQSGSTLPVVHWLELMADNARFGEEPPQ